MLKLTHCAYPQRDGQAEFTWMVGNILIGRLLVFEQAMVVQADKVMTRQYVTRARPDIRGKAICLPCVCVVNYQG